MKKELFYIAIMLFGLLLGACSPDEPTNEPTDEPVEATELTLALSTADIEVGETLEIEYTILPEDADNKSITWSTSNADVATVSAEGVVTALARGSATITAELGTLKASCEVNVWSVADQVIESEFLDIRYWGDYYNTGYDNFTVSFGT
ncbi:MAG: Ig-like domain-containing protein, partial [Alistipes sp.]|nr:Ig-like domain-containing protein [Alistipes sp.]